MSNILPGIYIAKVHSHAITETSTGKPQAEITFTFDGGKSMNWFGSFNEGKASEITIKALLTCGLKGNNPAGDLEIGKEVQIVVGDETGTDGKVRSKIRWVNPIGGNSQRKHIAPDAARAKLSSLEGAVMAARADRGALDDLPF